jgi:diguanylate cyclase (GGDEF)-like protein
MNGEASVATVLEIGRDDERKRMARVGTLSVLAGLPLVILLCLAAGSAAGVLFPQAGGLTLYAAIGVLAAVFAAPHAIVLNRVSQAQNRKISIAGEVREREMARQARRREFETCLANALEMAEDEPEVLDAVQRAITATLPEAPAELLLADNSHAHLSRMVTASPSGEPPGCGVDSPENCPAARRAQVQRFRDSEALDACPKLRARPQGRCSAVCVPVSIMGRTVGVIHATPEVGANVDEARLQDLQTLANLAGNRIGMIRIMAETQLQASTDSLTGLVNRRTLEARVQALRAEGSEFALVMTDLDHFKDLNDTYGHETGDRALRLFATTLREEMRAEDTVCRYGGEEFTLVLPRVTMHEAVEILERVQHSLALAITRGGVPTFTASFGIAHSSNYADFEEVVASSDQALFRAKAAGRDCIWIDGETVPASSAETGRPALVASTVDVETA